MAVVDDFSFPVVQSPLSPFTLSSPVWPVSPQISPEFCHEDGRREEVEEKMDILWEDFNEELDRERRTGGCVPDGVAGDLAEAIKVPRQMRRVGVVAHRRQSVVVVLKVLKKIFLIQNSARLIRRRKTDRCYLNR